MLPPVPFLFQGRRNKVRKDDNKNKSIYSAIELCTLRVQTIVPARSTEGRECKEQTPTIYLSGWAALVAPSGPVGAPPPAVRGRRFLET